MDGGTIVFPLFLQTRNAVPNRDKKSGMSGHFGKTTRASLSLIFGFTLLQSSISDPLLRLVVVHRAVPLVFPKVWHNFLRKFTAIKFNATSSRNVVACMGTLTNISKGWLVFAKVSRPSPQKLCDEWYLYKCWENNVYSKIYYPIGHIMINIPEMVYKLSMGCDPFHEIQGTRDFVFWPCFVYPKMRIGVKKYSLGWKIEIGTKQLGLNVTFLHFDISVRSQFFCEYRYLLVRSMMTHSSFQYCGQWPKFSLYLPPSDTYISIVYFAYGKGNVKAFYSILDAVVLINKVPEIKFPTFVFSHMIIQRKVSLYQYHIVQRKIFKLVSYIQADFRYNGEHYLRVLDGPGHLSSFLKQSKGYYKTSSFQCVAVLQKAHKNNDAQSLIYYRGVSGNLGLIKMERKRDFYLSSVLTNSSQTILIKVQSTEKSQQNLSVSEMVFEGLAASFCLFGGLAILESDTENSVLCNTYRSALSQNFYMGSGFIVFFSYHHYSCVAVKIILETLICPVVVIDPCAVRKQCSSSAGANCNNYTRLLNSLTQSVNFSPGEAKISMAEVHISYFDHKKCTVIQVRQGTNPTETEKIDNCFMKLILLKEIFITCQT